MARAVYEIDVTLGPMENFAEMALAANQSIAFEPGRSLATRTGVTEGAAIRKFLRHMADAIVSLAIIIALLPIVILIRLVSAIADFSASIRNIGKRSR